MLKYWYLEDPVSTYDEVVWLIVPACPFMKLIIIAYLNFFLHRKHILLQEAELHFSLKWWFVDSVSDKSVHF